MGTFARSVDAASCRKPFRSYDRLPLRRFTSAATAKSDSAPPASGGAAIRAHPHPDDDLGMVHGETVEPAPPEPELLAPASSTPAPELEPLDPLPLEAPEPLPLDPPEPLPLAPIEMSMQ